MSVNNEPQLGGITFVEPTEKRSKKRVRVEMGSEVAEDNLDSLDAPPEPKRPATMEVSEPNEEIEVFSDGDSDDDDEEEEKTRDTLQIRVHRLLAAKRRMRRLGKHMMNQYLEEDKTDVEAFMALTKEQQLAYLALYEFDSTSDDMLEGMAKLSSMAVRGYAGIMCSSTEAEIVNRLLEAPEVKDSLATAWDCVGVGALANSKPVRFISAAGHVGDAIARAIITVKAKAEEITEKVKRSEELEKRKASGIQSIFDVRASHASSEEKDTDSVPSQERAEEVVDRI